MAYWCLPGGEARAGFMIYMGGEGGYDSVNPLCWEREDAEPVPVVSVVCLLLLFIHNIYVRFWGNLTTNLCY